MQSSDTMASEISADAAVLSVLSEMAGIFPLKEHQNDAEGFSWSGRVVAGNIGKPRIGGTQLMSSLATNQKPRACLTNLIAPLECDSEPTSHSKCFQLAFYPMDRKRFVKRSIWYVRLEKKVKTGKCK